MKWTKLGLVFGPKGDSNWARHSALTPTPIVVDEKTIRVYAGFRDDEGVSRIGFVDLDAQNPRIVKRVSKAPALDRGRDGCFDDNGVILGDVVRVGDRYRMYYVGFQLVARAKFLAFTGVAESTDGGETFVRLSEAPCLDRAAGATTIRAIHSVLHEGDSWRIWFAVGDGWETINGQQFPQYNIWTTTSSDGLRFDEEAQLCVDTVGDEYRIGRPSVYRVESEYLMFYTKGTRGGAYFPGIARSRDGLHWDRHDETFEVELSDKGFDSRHLAYPRLLQVGDKTYCFYNGNDMGREGFGAALVLDGLGSRP